MKKKALILAAALVVGVAWLAGQPKEVACCLDGAIVYSEAVSAKSSLLCSKQAREGPWRRSFCREMNREYGLQQEMEDLHGAATVS